MRCFLFYLFLQCIWVLVVVAECNDNSIGNIILMSHILQFYLGDPDGLLRQVGCIIPPACSGSALESPPILLGISLQGDTFRRHPDWKPEPPQLAPFNTYTLQFYSKLLEDIFTYHLIHKGKSRHPAQEVYFSVITHGECIDESGTVDS